MSLATASGTLRDLVVHAAQGAKLLSSPGKGGERDFWHAFSSRDRERLRSAGFVSGTGFAPDQFAELVRSSGALPMELTNGNADQVCAWWVRLALESLDMGAGRDRYFDRRGELRADALDDPDLEDDQACTVPPAATGDLPAWASSWLEGLVFGPKREYARAYLESVYLGAPSPERPSAEWVKKVESKVARRMTAEIERSGS